MPFQSREKFLIYVWQIEKKKKKNPMRRSNKETKHILL